MRCDVSRLDLSICREATIYLFFIPAFVRKEFMSELGDVSDLGPAEMDVLGYVFLYKVCGFTVVTFVYKIFRFTAVPSVHDCAAQFDRCIFHVQVHSFTAVSFVYKFFGWTAVESS